MTKFKCLMHDFNVSWEALSHATGCPVCKKLKSFEEKIELLEMNIGIFEEEEEKLIKLNEKREKKIVDMSVPIELLKITLAGLEEEIEELQYA